MKIALVHDQLQEFGGAERVFVSLCEIYPDADIFTAFYNPQALGIHDKHFKDRNVITSWAGKIPFFGKLYSPLRFLAPQIWESFDFSEYDLVISSSGWYMCKGVKTNEDTKHICYLHHPPRYLYGYETAVEWQKYWPVKIYAHIVNHFLRQWDFISSKRPDFFVANSEETKRRIEKFYRRDSDVIYPPVTIPSSVNLSEAKNLQKNTQETGNGKLGFGNYFITLSRLTHAKHIEVLIEAANKAKFQLKIIGSGRDEEYLKSIAGETVEFLNHIPDEEFEHVFSGAKGFLFASVDEEFGIAPIEAMGYGIPVIAYASGGLKETIQNGANGYLYDALTAESLLEKIKTFEKLSDKKYQEMRKEARKSAEKYSFEEFKKKILGYVNRHLKRIEET